jgi:hypothetical protein
MLDDTLYLLTILRFNLAPIILLTSAILSLIAFCIGWISEIQSKEWEPPMIQEEVLDEDPQPC